MTEVLELRVTRLEKDVDALKKQDEVIGDLRVEIAKLQTQTKITWGLMLLVISGLVGVAFSLWRMIPQIP